VPWRLPRHRERQNHGDDVDRRGHEPRATTRRRRYRTIKQRPAPFPAAPPPRAGAAWRP
jgi:hypothetical protein